MPQSDLHVVTGAFGYSGRYIATRLLAAGMRVRTLTNSTHRENPFGDRVEAHPFHFDDHAQLVESLRGARVLYNTYWVRYNSRHFTHVEAVANSLKLFSAARDAGVGRVVHVSITNPAEDAPFEYFRGKALLEKALIASGLSYAILRPAVLFGGEDILINNIAWALRRLPVFSIFGRGDYCLQPIHVDDLAALAVAQGQEQADGIIDAIGPESFTFRELIERIGRIIGTPPRLISLPASVAYPLIRAIGLLLGDVILTREEIDGLMAGLLCTDSPPAGSTKLTEWARQHADTLGRHYASELARRRNRQKAYANL
ncbi:MAG TPA: NAD(P)H-binding protein [Armatimonadota bacterium]|jgi:NADH dehydrogenase